jgi:hypothetical protein
MPRFYFHYRDQKEYVPDVVGEDFPNLNAAILEAEQSAIVIVKGRRLIGKAIDDEAVYEIADDKNNIVAHVPFSSVPLA